jgi:hypothetical protein
VAVLKPRERLVYFRISEDEFRQFVSVCEEAGARSVSDLARNAVQRLIAEGRQHREDQDIDAKIRVLERLIAAVTEQLQLLTVNQASEGSALETYRSAAGFFPEANAPDPNRRREE